MYSKWELSPDVTLKNRVVLAPLTRGRAEENGVPTDIMAEYYRQRSNAGLMISEATGISRQGLGWFCAPGIWEQSQVEGWKKVCDTVHEEGGVIFLQLWHMGRQASGEVTEQTPVAPSAIKLDGEVTGKNGKKAPYVMPRALETEEVAHIVQDYKNAAKNAMEAGFDGVEIHAANGYLIDEFLQSKTNKRTDKYGGSVENRLRFLEEVMDAVLEVVPASRTGVRFSPNGAFGEMGSADNEIVFDAAIEASAKRNLAYVHVMDGLGFGFHELHEQYTLERARSVITKAGNAATKVMGNVGYEKESAEEVVAKGHADFIAFGRPYISNPDLAIRMEKNLKLAEPAAYEDWWTPGLGAKGYTDFPTYDQEIKQEEKKQ